MGVRSHTACSTPPPLSHSHFSLFSLFSPVCPHARSSILSPILRTPSTPYTNWHALDVPQTVRNRSMRMALPIHACGARGGREDTLCEGKGAASTRPLLNWDECLFATCSCMPTYTPPVYLLLLLLLIIIIASAHLGSQKLTRWLRGWRSRSSSRRHQQTLGCNSPPSRPTSIPQSLGRTRLPARRVSRRRYLVSRGHTYWALALLLGGKHLLFVEAARWNCGGVVGRCALTDAEFKTASWGTFDYMR